ncbi:GNAT family N-acetyltransferase [Bacillus sp. BGMRC 2118]|nr:GNAT family N-acetyltransferase [Bacillus sp. BGMRC 2118]
MIKELVLSNDEKTKELYAMQKASYMVEAELINFYNIPPLMETFEELVHCGEKFLGYIEDGQMAGAVSYTVEDEEVTICRMIVHPEHFRKGIAGKLLTALEEKTRQYNTITVSTGKENLPAKRLYLKHHFTFVQDKEVVSGLSISIFMKQLEK